jgi:glycosyltransferase involved in cell wall biosynthesis
MRVKLLEAFAAGIPVVSTRMGAEGLAVNDGEYCALADDEPGFAERVVDLLNSPEKARELAVAARRYVAATKDIATMTDRLVENYRELVCKKRGATKSGIPWVGPDRLSVV